MSNLIIPTKLTRPPVREDLVLRQKLHERLTEGLAHRLTLVCAPAGFGKTTLVSTWLKQLFSRVAWLSLDQQDNDISRRDEYLERNCV